MKKNTKLFYCTRCCLPETSPKIKFDKFGICNACRSSEQKMKINWNEREKILKKILLFYKKNSKSNYDCIVPISGGKDSIYQLHVLKNKYGMNPLAVTYSHNWFTKIGIENLNTSIEKLDVDHIMFTPKRTLVNRLAKKSLYKIGDACWHCHMGVETFPYQIASKWNIKLMIYGESPSEFSGKDTYDKFKDLEIDHFLKGSAKVKYKDMMGKEISENEMNVFKLPSNKELKKIRRIFLGNYMFWDLEKQTEFVKKRYGWKESNVEGTYKKYKSVECKMPGVHDYAKFLKRGFGRGTDFASNDVRAGLLTREEGFKIAKKYDEKEPKALKYYLEITGIKKKEFYETLYKQREAKAKNLPKKNVK